MLTVKSETKPCQKDAQRLIRLFSKIQRRTKDMKIEQDLVEIGGQSEKEEVK